MSLAVIDITRANPGTERKLVEGVLSARTAELTCRPVVVGFDAHESTLSGALGMIEFRSVGSWVPEARINEFIRNVLDQAGTSSDAQNSIIYSFHPSVISREGALAGYEFPLEVVSLNSVRSEKVPSGTSWPEALMPLEEAVSALEAALRKSHVTSAVPVLKTRVRDLLSEYDGRFKKKSSPAAATPGLMTVLLNEAQRRDIIDQSGVEPRVMVWLKGELAASVEVEDEDASAAGTVTSQLRELRIEVPEDEGDLSKAYQNTLRAVNFGIFPEVRERFYENIRVVVESAEGVDARTACREARVRTFEQTPETIERPAHSEKGNLPRSQYAWKALEEFGLEVLSRAGLLELDTSTGRKALPWELPVAAVKAPLPGNFNDRLDAEMVRELVMRGFRIRWTDRKHVAGAILNGRTDELIDRVESMISLLFEADKVRWDADGECLRPPS